MPSAASTDAPSTKSSVTRTASRAPAKAVISRCATASTSPRFQASSGPNGTSASSGTISGPKVRSKNGAPTEILSPESASTTSG